MEANASISFFIFSLRISIFATRLRRGSSGG
jgi:hypothetical protein